jgi:hypothetical protein
MRKRGEKESREGKEIQKILIDKSRERGESEWEETV